MDTNSFSLTQEYFEGELEIVFKFVTDCHSLLLDQETTVPNDEEKIRNMLISRYLTDGKVKKQLGFRMGRFCAEAAEIDKISLSESGYIDLKVCLAEHFCDDEIYFIIECKRVDGSNDLNREYVKEGINRFINEQYSIRTGVTGMIGFCVSQLNLSDLIDGRTKSINHHVDKWISNYTDKKLQPYIINQSNPIVYRSMHSSYSSKNFNIFHMFLDFSSLIDNSQINRN